MARVFVWRETEVVQPEHHHARSKVRPFERGLASQREVRYPFRKPRTKIRPPQELGGFLPVHRGHAALGLQHLARPAIHLPANIERQLRLDAHRSLPLWSASVLPPLFGPVRRQETSHDGNRNGGG